MELKGGQNDKINISKIVNAVQEVDDEQLKSQSEIKDENLFALLA